MRHWYSPFLLVIGPGADPASSLQMRSIPTVNGGGEPSSIVTLPFKMMGYVLAAALSRTAKAAMVMRKASIISPELRESYRDDTPVAVLAIGAARRLFIQVLRDAAASDVIRKSPQCGSVSFERLFLHMQSLAQGQLSVGTLTAVL